MPSYENLGISAESTGSIVIERKSFWVSIIFGQAFYRKKVFQTVKIFAFP